MISANNKFDEHYISDDDYHDETGTYMLTIIELIIKELIKKKKRAYSV
jgi:hypothetical protein